MDDLKEKWLEREFEQGAKILFFESNFSVHIYGLIIRGRKFVKKRK